MTSTLHAEPLLVSVEGQGALPLTAPQSDLFGPGASVALGVRYPLAAQLLLGVELRAGLLTDGAAPLEPGRADPSLGSFELALLSARLRPLAAFDGSGQRRATGLFLDLAAGGGVTGDLVRLAGQIGLGWGIGLGSSGLALAPTLRYLHVLQPANILSSADARLLVLGFELTFFDRVVAMPRLPAPKPPSVKDRDRDGIEDAQDHCVESAEDMDGHADADGCPEPDNDADGLPDVKDKCPDAAEDRDSFEDDDGCPEPDNDRDGVADAVDQCPVEAEVVNGNRDEDGCPDAGLIVFENDRIVLEERVLFDSERARIKNEARPMLQAIVKLKQQHPEWSQLRVEGHADPRGDAEFNQQLSERRARNVMEDLVKLGIPAEQIEAVGYGATRPRDKRDDDEGNRRNRRVEFVVVTRTEAPTAPPPAAETKPAAPAPAAETKPVTPSPAAGTKPAAPAPAPAAGAPAPQPLAPTKGPSPAPPPAAAPAGASPLAPLPAPRNAGPSPTPPPAWGEP